MAKLWVLRLRPLARVVVDEGARLVGIALVAVGVSGLLPWGMGATAGKGFVAGDPPGVTYTTARCADVFEYAPHARSCEQAATEHHFGEVVDSRIAAGVLGAVVLAVAAWRRRRHVPPNLLPETLVPARATGRDRGRGASPASLELERAAQVEAEQVAELEQRRRRVGI